MVMEATPYSNPYMESASGLSLSGNPAATYDDILRGYNAQVKAQQGLSNEIIRGYDQTIKNAQGLGDSQRYALMQQFDRQLAQQQQSMINRGLGNTTVLDSGARGINYDRAAAQVALNDALSREQSALMLQKLGYQGHAADNYQQLMMQGLGFQEGSYSQARQAELQAAAAQQAYQNQLGIMKQQNAYDTAARQQQQQWEMQRLASQPQVSARSSGGIGSQGGGGGVGSQAWGGGGGGSAQGGVGVSGFSVQPMPWSGLTGGYYIGGGWSQPTGTGITTPNYYTGLANGPPVSFTIPASGGAGYQYGFAGGNGDSYGY